ncbi:hypothetical protein CH63R_12735 [Colletotrichum higginsianum IMI 349063]|uniref:Uncharacterized protein n=1 Tax=Colletotrichum higginsianum (strain IMI 349063) TaxID=759273 RepID=A0A1B7XV44_COLHI|nr:hypothetical protein CH63R_12735 [Colletotrichum higginsianum IMI 349063]OBR03608.1 hypothetical protein CH63R_12735 [Colletotrichum higginsianum IMI 349063]
MPVLADKLHNIPSTSSLPTYSSVTEIELAELSPSTSSSNLPPTYDDATATATTATVSASTGRRDVTASSSSEPSLAVFAPTVHFQIETLGKQWLSLPVGTRPDPIPVHRVEAGSWDPGSLPAYVSLRFSRSDNSCHLVRGDDASKTPVCTTLYRFGPGRPPVFRLPQSLVSPHGPPGSPAGEPMQVDDDDDDDDDDRVRANDGELDLPIVSNSLTTRAQRLKTPLGTFQWRYASSRERAAAVECADDLLVCELVRSVAVAGGKKTEEGAAATVAQFVRGPGTRTKGSGRSTAGNGGRLMVDLARWTDRKDGARDAVEVLVVASCVCMLKKEVDRRRIQQMMIMAGGAGGG